ncbi:MAG TPA: hypothetical protein PKA39_06470, partial [Ignavibacteria bacterium]|nr:hypothetical protein [Ignavibacteria bacterium]
MDKTFGKYRQLIDARLTEFLDEETKRSRYCSKSDKYPYSLFDPLNYIMAGGGKRVRPILVLLS